MAADMTSALERLVLAAMVTGVVSWVTATWRSSKVVQKTVGDGIAVLGKQIGELNKDLDTRLNAMSVAAEAQRAKLASDMALMAAQSENRFQRIEQVIWDTDQRGGMRYSISVLLDRAERDRELMQTLSGQVRALVETMEILKVAQSAKEHA